MIANRVAAPWWQLHLARVLQQHVHCRRVEPSLPASSEAGRAQRGVLSRPAALLRHRALPARGVRAVRAKASRACLPRNHAALRGHGCE